MSKRRAGTELTHDNWDQEEEDQEEAGVFKSADKDTISKRAIKKAKRRFAGGETEAADSSSSPFAAFKGFSGFGATASATKKPDLTFGGGRENKAKIALTPAENTAPVISSFVIKSSPKPTSTSTTSSKLLNSNGTASSLSSSVFKANMNPEYSSQLRSLNQSVSAWIQQHVNANPLCDLTPVFEDYKKHLQEIESKNAQKEQTETKGSGDASASTTSITTTSTTESSSLAGFSFTKSSSTTTTTSTAPSQSTFSFKPTTATGTSSSSSGFSFAKSSTASEPSAGGAVGQVKPFSFGVAQATTSSGTEAAKAGAGEDEPPKVEFKQVEEKDALYSKRCKLFYKKDGAFKDRGVGMLHLKKTGDKGQMLLRADTNLGNVILNVGIHPKMPATRQGKNNVMIMTAMNPPINEKCPKCKKKYPAPQESNRCESNCAPDVEPLLLRVKTGEDADQLLAEIAKLKE